MRLVAEILDGNEVKIEHPTLYTYFGPTEIPGFIVTVVRDIYSSQNDIYRPVHASVEEIQKYPMKYQLEEYEVKRVAWADRNLFFPDYAIPELISQQKRIEREGKK